MGVTLWIWPTLIGLLWLLGALPVHGRGDTFEADPLEDQDEVEARNPSDDILDINQELILLETPESSFLMEGDIIKASPFRLFFSANPRWPKKRGIVQIPYIISYRYDKSSMKIIQEAFEDFARLTCVKFVPYSYQRDFISIAPLSGVFGNWPYWVLLTTNQKMKCRSRDLSCFSSAGRVGGMQVVSLAPACLHRGKGVALHELMHVLGFWHEHSRADRDEYISISWDEILTGFEMNFMKSWNTNMLADYDYSSVMHYGRNAFSMTGLPTIIPLSGSSTSLGQRWNLSDSDIVRVNKLYKCSQVAAQPETSTERGIRKKMRDFIPTEPQPCSSVSKVKSSTAGVSSTIGSATESTHPTQETLEAIVSSSYKAVGEGISIPEDPMRTTWSPGKEDQIQTVRSPKASNKENDKRKFPAATEKMLLETPSREMKGPTVGSPVKKTSVTLQSSASRTSELLSQPPSDQESYLTSEESHPRSRTKTAAETELTLAFVTEGSVPFSSDIVQGATRRPGRKEEDEELSGTTRVTSLKHSIGLSTALEMGGSLGTGSSEFEGANGSPHQTKGYSVSVAENYYKEQRTEMVHPAINTSGNETGSPAHTFPMEDIQTIVMNSSYRASTSRVSTNLAPLVEEGEEILGYETTGFSNVPIQTGMVEEVVESSDSNKGSMPPSMGSTSETNQDTTNEHAVPSSKEVLPLARVEDPENHLGWATPGPPSLIWTIVTATVSESHGVERGTGASMEAKTNGKASVWRLFSTGSFRSPLPTQPGHFAHSKLKEGSISWGNPAGHSSEEEPFSRTSAHWGKKGDRRVTYTQSTPLGSAFMKTEGQTFPDHVELPSQISTSGKWTSPSMKSHQVTSSSEGENLSWPQSHKTARLRATVSQPQSSNKEGFSPTAFSVGWGPSGDGQREKIEHVMEEAFIGRGEKPSTEPKVSESHGEEAGTRSSIEAKTHGKAPFWRLFSTESFRSPLPTQAGHWLEENQRSRSPTLVRETNSTGEGQSQIRTQSPNGLGPMVPLRPCEPISGTKSSLMEGTAKRKVSLAAHLKLGATSEESQGPENKGLSSALEEVTLPVTEMGTHPRWLTGSTNLRERERAGNYTVVLVEEASSASLSQPTQTVTSVGPSHISTTSVLSNPTLKASPSSSPFWGAEPVMSSESPAPPTPEIKIASKSNVTIQPAERRPPEPGNVREEKFLQATEWVTRPTQEVTPGGNVAVSTVQPKPLPHVPTEGGGLLSTTSYLESSKFMHYRERSTSSHQRTGSLPSAGEDVTVATTVASSAYLTTAIPLEFRASQANISISSKLATGSPSKKRGETTVETNTTTPVLVESHRIPSAVGSLLVSPTAMATIPQLQNRPRTESELLEEFIWAPSEPKGTELILEGKEENLTLKSSTYASEISTAAVYTGVEAQGSRKKGLGGPSIGGGWQSSLSTYPKYVEKIEKVITVHKVKESTRNFVTPSIKLHSDTSMTPRSNTPMMEISTSVPGVQKTPATDKMDRMFSLVGNTEGMYLKEKESMGEATITLGTSQRHTQTSGSFETGFWSKNVIPHVTQDPGEPSSHNGFLLTKAMHVEMSSGEVLPPSGQIPETPIVAKVEETTGSHRTGMRDFSEDKPDSLYHVVKRSLEQMVRSNAGYLSPKKVRLEKESSKEHVLRRTLMATSAGLTHHMPVPGTFKRDVDGPHVGHKDGTFPEEHMAKAMEPAKATLVSASRPKALTPLHHRLFSSMTNARNEPKTDKRTVKAAHSFFCSFEKGLCSWEQSKNDDLDWVLEKEEEMQVASVEDGTTSGKPRRISGSHISLKPSGLVPVQKAVLISPILNGLGCIKFWYNTMEATMGGINFYRKSLNSSEWHKVWSMKGNQGTSWHLVTVSIYDASELQVALEGLAKRRPLEIDDLLICQKPCWRCYNPAPSVLCKNRN